MSLARTASRIAVTGVVLGVLGIPMVATGASSQRPWIKEYFPGSSYCPPKDTRVSGPSASCYFAAPAKGYVDRQTVTASYTHSVRVGGTAEWVKRFLVYTSGPAKKSITVEWQVICYGGYRGATTDTQGTFRLTGKGRRTLKMPGTGDCFAAATARGRGRLYLELDGVPLPGPRPLND